MQLKNYNVYFFFVVLIGITVLAYFVMQPFLVPFLIAAIMAHLFSSMYKWLLKITGKKRGISSALICLVIALIILIPIFFISSLVVQEIQNTITNLVQSDVSTENIFSKSINSLSNSPLRKFVNVEKIISPDAITSAANSFSQTTLMVLQGTYQGVAHIAFVIFATFFSLFYLFIDGEKLVKKIMKLSPLKDSYENILIIKFNSIVRATIKGTILIAMMQGFLGGILFAATGVSSPILLGLLMMLASVIPAIGAGLVWLPVGIFMMLSGNVAAGVEIILFGALVISMLDNFIRPKLVGQDTEMHPLLILFSTLGGITLFGIAGFIVGPIVASLFVSLWEIYYLEFKSQLKEFNK